MRYIEKGNSPAGFELWKAQEEPTNWSNLPSNLPPEEQREDGVHYYSRVQLLGELVTEQRELCAYCTQRIAVSHRTPIDHVVPREGDAQTHLIFDYSNLVASCDGNQRDSTKPIKRHCDAAKGSKLLPITPLQADCESRIRFADNGKIVNPEKDPEVTTTVEILNLNLARLVNHREAAIASEVFEDVEQTILLSVELARKRLDQLRALGVGDGPLPEWYTAIVTVLEKLAALD